MPRPPAGAVSRRTADSALDMPALVTWRVHGGAGGEANVDAGGP
jgi:hypothetical protein